MSITLARHTFSFAFLNIFFAASKLVLIYFISSSSDTSLSINKGGSVEVELLNECLSIDKGVSVEEEFLKECL